MLQVGAVGFPVSVIGDYLQPDRLAGGFDAVACHHLAARAGDGFQRARTVDDVVPFNPVAHLRVLPVVLLHAEALAVQSEFHLVGIGVGVERERVAFAAVPVVAHAVGSGLYAVPHRVGVGVYHADVHQRLIGEHAFQEIGYRLGLERDVERALRPSLGRPSLAFA